MFLGDPIEVFIILDFKNQLHSLDNNLQLHLYLILWMIIDIVSSISLAEICISVLLPSPSIPPTIYHSSFGTKATFIESLVASCTLSTYQLKNKYILSLGNEKSNRKFAICRKLQQMLLNFLNRNYTFSPFIDYTPSHLS